MIGIGLSYETLAQAGHVLFGCFLVEHFGKWTKRRWEVLLLVLLAASFKEFYLDLHYEDVVTRGSDLIDFLYWGLGGIIGLILSHLEWN